MLGEMHESRQEWEVINKLVAAPGFAERVNDIVMEFGNARYQDVVDRYVAGEVVPLEQVQPAWRDVVGALGATSPVYGDFYAAAREVNRKLPPGRRLRILCGDPPLDWSRVQSRDDLAPFLPFRDAHYGSVVRYEVLAKNHKALLIMGSGHFQRNGGRPGGMEQTLLIAAAKAYVVMPGSNMNGGYDDVDARFEQWPAPWLAEMKGNWIGAAGQREQMADAYLYLGPRDKMTRLRPRRAELIGTPYGKEIERRLTIIFDKAPPFVPDADEQPQFEKNPAPPPRLPAPPKPH
jgi:hypothetical protein